MQGNPLKQPIQKPQVLPSSSYQQSLPEVVEVNAPPEKKPSSLAEILAQQDELQR